jgi:hypothetical protein
MTSNIVSVLTQQELLDLFCKEADIDNSGKSSFTRRGIARLVGKSEKTIRNLLAKCSADTVNGSIGFEALSKPLKPFAGIDFSGGDKISDIVVWAIVNHYAREGDSRCQDLQDVIGTIGLRVSVQNAQQWQSDRSASEQLVWQYVLAEPRKWSAQFPDEYYNQLARLTNIYPKGANRPHYWANLTNELVYGYLPKEIEAGVRNAKAANASHDKLHQYLQPDGLDMLQKHLDALMVLMSSVACIEDLRKLTRGRFAGNYQMTLQLRSV